MGQSGLQEFYKEKKTIKIKWRNLINNAIFKNKFKGYKFLFKKDLLWGKYKAWKLKNKKLRILNDHSKYF